MPYDMSLGSSPKMYKVSIPQRVDNTDLRSLSTFFIPSYGTNLGPGKSAPPFRPQWYLRLWAGHV